MQTDRRQLSRHRCLVTFTLVAVATLADAKPWASWLIRPDANDSWAVEISNDPTSNTGYWRLVDSTAQEVARLPAPEVPKGYSLNLGQCKINGALRQDVVAIVKHKNGVQWARSVAKAWIVDTRSRAFLPTATRNITCLNEGFGI